MKNQRKTLFDMIMIDDMDLINYAFSFLKYNYRQILLRTYGINLTDTIDISVLAKNGTKKSLTLAINSLKRIIDRTEIISVTIYPEQNDCSYFYQYFKDYNPKNVFKIVQELDSSKIMFLQSIYGIHFLNAFQDTNLSEYEKKLYWGIMNEIDNKLSTISKVFIDSPTTYIIGYDYTPSYTGAKPKSIAEYYSNYSIDEIRKAVSKLNMEDRMYIHIAYGRNYDDISGYRQIPLKEKEHLVWIVKSVLRNYLEESHKDNSVKNIFNLLSNYDKDSVLKAINELTSDERRFFIKCYDFAFNGNNIHKLTKKNLNDLNSLIVNRLIPIIEDQFNSDSETDKKWFNYFEQLFLDYSFDTVLEVIASLKEEDIILLKKTYGDNFKDNHYSELTSDEQGTINCIIRRILRKCNRMKKTAKRSSGSLIKEGIVTDDIVYDRLKYTGYRNLSRQEEIDFIKKAKLSYYDSVDDRTKDKYLEYYMEVFPKFRVRYQNASLDEKEELLREAIKNSLMYRNLFIENNLPFVFSLAKRYYYADAIEDLYQEGVTGLVRALELFDVEAGFKFSTYAHDWILHPIRTYIPYYSYSVHLPIYKYKQLNSVDRIVNEFEVENGRKPSKQELAELMNISVENLNELDGIINIIYPGSLDESIKPDADTCLVDMIVNEESSIEDIVESRVGREAFIAAVERSNLTRPEKKVLFLHYGIFDDNAYDVDELAFELSVSHDRILNIEKIALMKLRTNPEIIAFKDVDFSSISGDSSIDNMDKNSLVKKRN